MSMKTGLMAVMVASALASATLLGGCFGSGDVNNETTQPEENKTEQTQTNTPAQTQTTTPEPAKTQETKPETKPEPEPKKEPVTVSPALSDAVGFAKVTSVDGMYVVAAFGDVTIPEAGSTDYTFTANGETVDFDVSYTRVLDAEGNQIPYNGAETLPVGTLVELGGGGEGENVYVETIQLVNFTAADGEPGAADTTADTAAAADTTANTEAAADGASAGATANSETAAA